MPLFPPAREWIPDLRSARSAPVCIDTPSQAAGGKTSAAQALPRPKPRPDAPLLPMAFPQLPTAYASAESLNSGPSLTGQRQSRESLAALASSQAASTLSGKSSFPELPQTPSPHRRVIFKTKQAILA